MTLLYHEEGTDPAQPFEYAQGLLIRPSDFSVTRTTRIDGSENFWWNRVTGAGAEKYHPVALLQMMLADWDSHGYGRAPFITALIHENNFYRSGPEAWSAYYFTIVGGQRGAPLLPPFDLQAPDPSQPRSPEESAAIWSAYEALVAYAAEKLQPVTSEDILQLAGPE